MCMIRETMFLLMSVRVNPPNEGILETGDTEKNFDVVKVEDTFVSLISARQKKREAKMLFSGGRAKGRHQT